MKQGSVTVGIKSKNHAVMVALKVRFLNCGKLENLLFVQNSSNMLCNIASVCHICKVYNFLNFIFFVPAYRLDTR